LKKEEEEKRRLLEILERKRTEELKSAKVQNVGNQMQSFQVKIDRPIDNPGVLQLSNP
jgi:hypothetical protein